MYLISACLLGLRTRYNGKSCVFNVLTSLPLQLLLPVCPEQLGGLPTPRQPAEIKEGEGVDVLAGKAAVLDQGGGDVSGAFIKGARETLYLAQLYNVKGAFLKDKSPSCGLTNIFDGNFSGDLRRGSGVTAALLRQHGIPVYPETALYYPPVD